MLYIITYDLRSPGKNYQSLWDALHAINARRALESVWATRRDGTSASGLRSHLTAFIDSNDRLLVMEVDDWSSFNSMIDLNDIY